jgi:bifunctional DNA-binding transcriptional regulator/antitoxin component of YhaV-PrlF toxin-antitoxin module
MNKIHNKSGELESVITKISSKNQITIPAQMIKQIGLTKNQRVKVTFNKKANKTKMEIEIFPDPFAKLRGILKGTKLGVADFLRERYEDDKNYDL